MLRYQLCTGDIKLLSVTVWFDVSQDSAWRQWMRDTQKSDINIARSLRSEFGCRGVSPFLPIRKDRASDFTRALTNQSNSIASVIGHSHLKQDSRSLNDMFPAAKEVVHPTCHAYSKVCIGRSLVKRCLRRPASMIFPST